MDKEGKAMGFSLKYGHLSRKEESGKKNSSEHPKCPSGVKDCGKCKETKAKKCDTEGCGSFEEVEFRHKYHNQCLCITCREAIAKAKADAMTSKNSKH